MRHSVMPRRPTTVTCATSFMPGTPLTAASLAMAERVGATGEEVLTAMVVGYEAAGRIRRAITPGFRRQGFHRLSRRVFAAAVAAARLLRLDAPKMAQSIAVAATSIGGLATAADTSTAREYHAGLAVLLGCNAALAAQRGYRPRKPFLMSQGLLRGIRQCRRRGCCRNRNSQFR